jgi:hypothetical protein
MLKMEDKEIDEILSVGFDCPKWDGIGHIRVVFTIFHHFGFSSRYKIENEKLFRFIAEIRDTYNPVPYHNWRHAVDVTQFMTYEILLARMDSVLTQFELFSMIVAGLCHDANHDGFTNAFNEKAETPLGILFKNQSVMETHHCAVSIAVLAKPQCNLFSTLDSVEYKTMWTTIIDLILATDMAKHFGSLKEFGEIFDAGEYSMEKKEHRLITMQMILKCADISNVARPFELADRWCDLLCEEFFRQGDLESATGMEYTSALNDRAHLDKAKSQIGFYTFVCKPLYEAAARAMPPLDANVKQLDSNLEIWKADLDRRANQVEIGV